VINLNAPLLRVRLRRIPMNCHLNYLALMWFTLIITGAHRK